MEMTSGQRRIRRRRSLSGSGSAMIAQGLMVISASTFANLLRCSQTGAQGSAEASPRELRYITMALVAPSREYLGRVFLSSQ